MKKFLIILIGILFTSQIYAQYFNYIYNHKAPESVLDGISKSFLVTGYSTSHQPFDRPWPSILQEMLNLHAGNDTTYFVFKHTVGGTPIAKWTNICGTGEHIQNAISAYINPASEIPAGVPVPNIILAQQSLQWAFGDCRNRFTSIENPGDSVKIEMGSKAIQMYSNAFIDAGIDKVYMATHIYKTGNYPLGLYGERWALAKAISETKNLLPGPELFNITKQLFPDGFANDKVHPGPEVATMMAVYWYLVLAGENAKMEIAQQFADKANVNLNSNPNKNLIAHWTFNEPEGEIAYDSTENHLDAQIYSAERIPGKKNMALNFTGNGGLAQVMDYNFKAPEQISLLNKGTISFWFKFNDITNGDTIPQSLPIFYYGQRSDSTPQNGLEIYIGHNNLTSQQRIYFTVHKNGKVALCFNNPFDLEAGVWYHYTVVIDSLDHRGYINGVEFSRKYNAGTSINHHGFFSSVPANSNELLTFGYGRFSSKKFWHFNGAIDEVMIFDKALTESEIKSVYGEITSTNRYLKEPNLLKVYPNPTNGVLKIESNMQIVNLNVFNQNGQRILYSENQKEIDLSNYPKGFYLLRIATKNRNINYKFLLRE